MCINYKAAPPFAVQSVKNYVYAPATQWITALSHKNRTQQQRQRQWQQQQHQQSIIQKCYATTWGKKVTKRQSESEISFVLIFTYNFPLILFHLVSVVGILFLNETRLYIFA